jgi:Putative phage holin Dp-1
MNIFSTKVYNILKSIAMIWLPALGTFIFTLGDIWRISGEHTAQVVGTIMAVDTFLGVLLGLTAKSGIPAPDGTLKVDTTHPDKDTYSLEIDTPLSQIPDKSHVTLKVDTTAK